ncbi:MAG TPA: VOC family protein [Steroidobacteraceae bacterium]|jgi:catechol 2,3-dioxygenase-like lactoylglutathione lyase family enzyme
MFDHTGIVVSDLSLARRFYEAIGRPLGLVAMESGQEGAFLLGRGPGQVPHLWIGTLRPSYWVPGSKPGINQMHVAFVAATKDAVEEFYTAGIAAGGRDYGPPGPRYDGQYYGAFVLDPDGNNIEACYRGSKGR